MKRCGYVMAVFICIIVATINVATPVAELEAEVSGPIYYDVIVGVTGYKYELGMKVTEDDSVISGYLFRDIAIGIAVWDASNVTIKDCVFINCSDEGIVFFSTSHNSTIENCTFIECCDGIELQQAHDTTITDCRFIRNYHAGIDIIGEASHNVSVNRCVFEDNIMDIFDLQERKSKGV